MNATETAADAYLVGYGRTGGFALFRAAAPLACRRGDAVVVRTRRGLELGQVLCPAGDRHARMLPGPPEGDLLRPATADDQGNAFRLRRHEQALFEDCQRLVTEWGLPVAVLDVEALLDGGHALVQYLAWGEAGLDGLAEALANRHGVEVLWEDVTPPTVDAGDGDGEHGSCGKPNCGQGGSGCDSCSSGGGCATGCGSGKVDMRAYFAHLRTQMEERHRVPLL
jgi:cell fate regulator YaaT (PSP1 superfamily)